ncbi:DUF3231 family protein [Halobacillus shinanisalinarum]|uniref:DUF3231 family protein n=1 Tax=Halobacillus shinanisalinarum TaxID=2932258 RepID=UPI0021071550|nr:DUF3231 family protein [Halobacillus shinanisalinarum]
MAKRDPRLNSSELSQLWMGYMQDSMTICTMKYFLQIVEDSDIRPVIKQALKLSEAHIPKLIAIFQGIIVQFPMVLMIRMLI